MAAFYVRELSSVQSQGPYLLGGYCLGGIVAFEMAQQISMQNAKAILISIEEFSTLTSTPEAELNTLTAEFDQMLDGMQGKKARRAMQTAFKAPPEELGRAAVRGARRS